MKAANQAWYWLAAGVLALGLNGYYQDGGLQALHRLAGRAAVAAVEARAEFQQIATLAEVALAARAESGPTHPEQVEVAVDGPALPPQVQARLAHLPERLAMVQTARVQSRVMRLQQAISQREMRRAQIEIQNGRIAIVSDQGQVRVALPPMPPVQPNLMQPPAIELMPN